MVEKLYLARPRGFCAGVVMAIKAVEQIARKLSAKDLGELTVYHPIVHNKTVVKRLEREYSAHFIERLDERPELEKKTAERGHKLSTHLVFSAHGVAPDVKAHAAAAGLTTIDATCPLVTKVHSEAKKYARLGYQILLIGDSTTHQEVIGTFGEAPHLTIVVGVVGNQGEDPGLANPGTVQVKDPEKIAVLTQTTLSVDDTDQTIKILRRRFPKLVTPSRDDLCYATKNRQAAIHGIADKVSLFLVVSSDFSSNGRRLLELAEKLMGNARRIERAADIDPAWFKDIRTIGLTSAASTPDDVVQGIVSYFRSHNPNLQLIEKGKPEEITFSLPQGIDAI
jgi:4-hydroxy-3-methylbut-2-enyl diphosphate reductase